MVVTCGSVTVDALRGPVEIVFVADDGTEATVDLPENNTLTFDPETILL